MHGPGHGPGSLPEGAPLEQRVFFAFFRALTTHRLLMQRRLAEHGMHIGQAFSLTMLAHHDGITQSELAEHLNVSRPTVTVMLQKMEKAGLILRAVDEVDQRCTRIHVTGAGKELHRRFKAVTDDLIAETIGPLAEKDQRELARLLGEFSANMDLALERAGEAEGEAE